MRYKVGAERVQLLRSRGIRPGPRLARATRAPAGQTHGIDTATGKVACGISAEGLTVFDQDWETASMLERCPACVAATAGDEKQS